MFPRLILCLAAGWALLPSAWAQREMGGRSTSPSSESGATAAEVIRDAAVAEAAEAAQAEAAPRAMPLDGVPRIARIAWYGHAFVYIVTPTGVRVAIDPYESNNLQYTFPRNLAADVVLTSNERPDHAAASRLMGNPQIFRSYTAVGSNRANGLLFKGVEVPSEPRKDFDVSKSIAFVFDVDGLNYAHFGMLGDRLSGPEARAIGKVDVVFLPVGKKELSSHDIEKVVKDLGAKVIVPIVYKTDKSAEYDLNTLEEFLEKTEYPVKEIDSHEFSLSEQTLPSEPTVYILKAT
ncbi:MAG: MBL fold metallo-hydrolase [Verrucomicrobiota bacterium]